MALSRVKTWITGDVLTAADLNAEFNNILNNPNALLFPSTASMNFSNQQAVSFVLENLTSDPTAGNAGRMYWNTSTNQVKVDMGTSFVVIGPSTAGSTGVSAAGGRAMGLVGSIVSNNATFHALELVMRTTGLISSIPVNATSSFTINTQTAGPAANGRDQAAVFGAGAVANGVQWYAISTGVNSTGCVGICSLSSPEVGPTMPTSYSAWCWLGASPYGITASAVMTNQTVEGGWYIFSPMRAIQTLTTLSPLTTGGTMASLDITASSSSGTVVVPPNADLMRWEHVGSGATSTGGGVDTTFLLGPSNTSTMSRMAFYTTELTGSGFWGIINGHADIPVINSTTLSVGTKTNLGTPQMKIAVVGYHCPNGG